MRTLVLLERGAEEAALAEAVARVARGSGALVILEAAGGLGKTSLLRGAGAAAREAGLRVLHARGSELESGFPFGVVRQVFEPLLFGAAGEERARWLAGAAALAGPMFEPAAEGATADPYQRLHGLYWLTANLCDDGPLVISVDDAQWADEPSLQFLGFLARRVEGTPVGLLVATRPISDVTPPALTQLVADPAVEVLRPRPLSSEAVGRLLAARIGTEADAAFVRACSSATQGNPLLLSELAREVTALGIEPTAAAAERVEALGPQGVATVVLARIARMPAAASALARALAVLGDGASLRTAAQLAQLGEEAVPALRTLLAAEVVVEGEGLAFVHPIVRAAVYESIADRSALHWRAARVLEAAGDADEAIGAQLLAAQPAGDPWAVERLRAAAARALGLGDPRGAVTHLRRALAEPPSARGEVLLELGRAEARAGDPEAIAHLERVIAETSDARLAARAALELAPVLKFAGESVRAVAVVEQALEGLDDPELREQLEIELFGSAYISIAARRLLAQRLAALPEPPAVPATDFDRFRLTGMAFDAFAAGRPADEVADLATRGLAHGLATDPTAGGHAFVSGVIALMFAERYDDADRLYSGALEDARRRGSGIAFATASSLRSLVAYRRGRLTDALADASAALELAADVHGSQGFLSAALGTLVYTALDQGTVDAELEALVERFVREAAADTLPYSHAMHAHACLRVHRGELEAAYQELLATGRRELEWGARNPAVTPWRSTAALVAYELGDVAAARELAFEEVDLARAFGAPRALGIALRAAGLVAEREQGIALLAEAVAVLERSLGALEHARALIDHGLLLVAVGADAQARKRLTAGHALAIRCGAAALAARAGVTPEPVRDAPAAAGALTPAEARVARMAADGMTNRDIAQALFVTQKTVEMHLGSVYRKLGVRSRRALPDALAG
ncbi:AAA family ATPase [Solirubrobacter sp. CPCC 204708]|uniref:AAA family ATPase n=1 Tax=Solirubrobacter deserti TaxID=2282478 RepID=A0ABT4REV4_9ACTN|nr:LuxR family transcriptional regulator [Solirubrobacter deserti]MBE2318621.1 AAA family ATPase [Solirubrobacter deserti]MDA0137079.1 AAA family ATPase [Solirubrobacter deserti]